jgi:hypothetical protein
MSFPDSITIHKTRVPEMGYAKITDGLWMFISLEDGRKSQVGPHYASKAELLADAHRYLTEYGY